MKFEEIKKLAVIGAGKMGSQITEILARIGSYEVQMVDMNDELVKKGLAAIEERLEQFYVCKGKMTSADKKRIIAKIRGSTSIENAVQYADFIIEAVTENATLKKEILQRLDVSSPCEAILASNTSRQNITDIASVTRRPEKVVGMHFFNPVAIMKLVEIVKGIHTSGETTELSCALARRLGKEPVICRDTSYGFLANRAYNGMLFEAVQMLWERVASPEDIDKSLKLGFNFPTGPLELGDTIGVWAIEASSEQDNIRELGSEKGQLHPLIRTMIRSGYTGGPGKKGIYDFWRDIMIKW